MDVAEKNKTIRSFRDLDVYNRSYEAMKKTHQKVLDLPKSEEYDLKSQLSRSVKAIPRLIAEGHSKRHQKRGFQKYLDDAMGESNETIVSLSQCKDLYPELVDVTSCEELIETYDITSRQLFNLALSWDKYNRGERKQKQEES